MQGKELLVVLHFLLSFLSLCIVNAAFFFSEENSSCVLTEREQLSFICLFENDYQDWKIVLLTIN